MAASTPANQSVHGGDEILLSFLVLLFYECLARGSALSQETLVKQAPEAVPYIFMEEG